jgi:hypothetical protein
MAQYTIIEPVAHELCNAANSASHAVSTSAVNVGIGLDRTEEAYSARYADSRQLYIVQMRGYVDGDVWETVTPRPISEARARYLADSYGGKGTWMYRAVAVQIEGEVQS